LVNGVVVLKKELIHAVNDFLGHPHFFFVIDKHPLKYYDRLIINTTDSAPKRFKALTEAVIKATGVDNCIDARPHTGTIPRTPNGKIRYFIDARKEA
jgi:hypothetical protein